MPDTIDFCFREAIAARTQITKFFRQKNGPDADGDSENENHEFFTESLRQLYDGLCECCARSEEGCRKKHVECHHNDETRSAENRFAVLKGRHHEKDSTNVEDSSGFQRLRNTDVDEKQLPMAKTEPQLVNDSLSDVFEMTRLLQVKHPAARLALVRLLNQALRRKSTTY